MRMMYLHHEWKSAMCEFGRRGKIIGIRTLQITQRCNKMWSSKWVGVCSRTVVLYIYSLVPATTTKQEEVPVEDDRIKK